jgi:hypothetical protein
MLSEINNLIDVKPGDKMNGCFVGITQSMSMNADRVQRNRLVLNFSGSVKENGELQTTHRSYS